MAQDTRPFHRLPITGAVRIPGQSLPIDNGHSKRLQQHYPSCTTQASLSAMADDQARPFDGCRTPSTAISPREVETTVPEDIASPSRSPFQESGAIQDGGAASSQEELVLKDEVHEQDHYSDDLQHRIKDMWPSRTICSDDCDRKYGIFQRRASEAASGCRFSQPVHVSQNDHDHDKLGSLSRDWMAGSQNLFQQPFAWSGLDSTAKPDLHPPFCYQDRLDLVDQGQTLNTSASYDPCMGHLNRSFDQANSNYADSISASASYQEYMASVDNVPITTLSSTSSLPFYEAPSAMHQDREDTDPFPEGEVDPDYKDEGWWQDQLLGDSPSSMDASGSKVDEPYAQLIYRAFLSRPNKSMTLQEIYQWFRENTDKSKAEGKGWQNSIRHNLSMNGAFTKRNSKTPLAGNGDGSVSLDNAGVDGRKSTEWFLEPTFYAGVESTTRYRKGNSGSRSRGVSSHQGRSRLNSDGHSGAGAGFSHARVSAGRKGGNVAAQNRKRLAERQQLARQMDLTRGHPRHLRHAGHQGPTRTPYGGLEEAVYYPHDPAPHFVQSPFPLGFGGGPAAMVQRQGSRQTDIVYNCFNNSDDVGRDADVKCSQRLGTDTERNEPLTPPGSNLDPPQSADFGSKQHQFLPEMTSSYNPLNSYHVGLGFAQHQHQHQVYTSADVAGFYESPVGGPQPDLFVDADIDLSSEDALLMNLSFGE